MELDRLSKLHYIRKEIDAINSRIMQIENSDIASVNYRDVVQISEKKSKTEKDYIAVSDLKEMLIRKKESALQEEYQLTEYINQIEDSYTALIFRKRFVDGKTWWRVAREIGGGNTADSCRMAVRRYLQKKN